VPWLMPVIPATQEAEIRRMAVQSQPQANRGKKADIFLTYESRSSCQTPLNGHFKVLFFFCLVWFFNHKIDERKMRKI
jgi:hypothetical protein